MKFFAFIISLYLLALSCYPCGDREEGNAKAEAKIFAATGHQQHKHENKECTPFCSCSCCPASAFYSPLPKLYADKFLVRTIKHPLYNIAFTTEAYYSIWQPPKLS